MTKTTQRTPAVKDSWQKEFERINRAAITTISRSGCLVTRRGAEYTVYDMGAWDTNTKKFYTMGKTLSMMEALNMAG